MSEALLLLFARIKDNVIRIRGTTWDQVLGEGNVVRLEAHGVLNDEFLDLKKQEVKDFNYLGAHTFIYPLFCAPANVPHDDLRLTHEQEGRLTGQEEVLKQFARNFDVVGSFEVIDVLGVHPAPVTGHNNHQVVVGPLLVLQFCHELSLAMKDILPAALAQLTRVIVVKSSK